jgi:hypothetical protein
MYTGQIHQGKSKGQGQRSETIKTKKTKNKMLQRESSSEKNAQEEKFK